MPILTTITQIVKTQLPLPLQQAINHLSSFLSSHAIRYGRSGSRHRGMRSDRRQNILAIATAMLHGASLQHDGLICLITRFWARPMSIAEMAHMAGICAKTASRCLADMQDLGLIECTQIKRRNKETGLLEVSIGIRRFTKKFWQALGLWDLYQQSVKWAKERAQRKLVMPFKSVSCKAKQAAKKAGGVVKAALGKMVDPDANRVRMNCQKILDMLRNKKE